MKKFTLVCLYITLYGLLSHIATGQEYTPITLNQIYEKYQFLPYTFSGLRSMSDGEHYTVLEGNQAIVSYDYQTGTNRNILFQTAWLKNDRINEIDDYAFSEDEGKVLLVTDKKMIYRHSYAAKYYIYNIRSGIFRPLSSNDHEQLAAFSPDGNKVAYVFNNNLFIYNLTEDTTLQVTSDGRKNQIINGAPDWVYEEEFGFTKAFCWSPDSKKLGYMRFDETDVKQYSLQLFNGLYPENYQYKYPKAGEKNSVVAVRVYDTESKETIILNTGSDTDHYLPRIKWTASAEYLSIIRLNRLQNNVEVLLANTSDGNTRALFHERNDSYIAEIDDDYLFFTTDNKYFIIRSERTGYLHYYLYSMDGSIINPVTKGNWEVDQIAGIDEKQKRIFYTSTEDSPLQRQLYMVHFDGSGKKKLSQKPGYVVADFSKTYKYYINTWSDANTPPQISVNESGGRLVRIITNNKELADDMKRHGFSKKEFLRIPVSDDLFLYAYIIKPIDFDSTRQYPLIISVYGGPESQDVVDAWDNDMPWQQLLAQQDIIVVCIDNRGTDGRGEAFRKSIYMQLGKLESEDQINAVNYLSLFNWINENRIGIWGWSYGGYVSLLCMAKSNGLFTMGIAVAPVTSWRFYDTIYTERFMRKPQDNPIGYDENSPLNHAATISGDLLLVHGTADDNVHLQNSIEMADRLIDANKKFKMLLYPDRDHSIYGGNTRFHLFTEMTDFVLENL